ncbi:MAG: hypothetical protein RIS51_847 [Actinomycetota bacterium]
MLLKMGNVIALFILFVFALTGCTSAKSELSVSSPSPAVKAGDFCEQPAAEVVGEEGTLLCTYNLGQGWTYIPLEGSGVFPGQNELTQLPIEKCKIEDNRPPEVRYFGATGFPAPDSRIPNNGEISVAIVPIDFPDALGNGNPMDLIQKELDTIDAWTRHFTNGRLKYKWTFSDQWLTMPKESQYYVWDKSYISDGQSFKMTDKQLQSSEAQASQVFTEAEKVMDLENVDYAWIFSNPEAKLVDWGPGPVSSATQTVKTATNTYEIDYFPIGTYLFGNVPENSHQRPLWTSMLHEMGHAHGIAGHAPGNEWTFDYMTAGGTLSSWNGWLMGWIPDDDFVCLDGTVASKQSLILDSVDLNRGGTIAAIVRISDHEVLVVESRKKGPFSIDFNPDYRAVMAYYVNTQREAQRYDGNLARELDYFSFFVRIANPDRPFDPNSYQVDPNILAQLGDTLVFENIRVKFAEETGFDTVEIEILAK